MKRLWIVLLVTLFMVVSVGFAAVIYTNQVTVGWDAVTKLSDGTTIPTGDVVSYQVYTKKGTATEVLVGEINSLQQTVTFTVEGEYLVGVRTKRAITGGAIVYSTITWSNSTDIAAVPVPFSVGYYIPPAVPKGLKPIP